MMKLNFWQWLGVILLIIGAAYYIYEKTAAKQTNPAPTNPPAATQPSR